MGPNCTRRLLKELQDQQAHPAEHQGFQDLAPRSDDCITEWQVVIVGPRDTGYD
ncbi:hypothetical protein IWQ60_007741, partial [Tieghemiomyces parasiticus]